MRGRSIKNPGKNNVIRLFTNRVLEINPDNTAYTFETIPQSRVKARIYKFKLKNPPKSTLHDEDEFLRKLDCTVSEILNYRK